MGILDYVEATASKLLYSVRGHDDQVFTKSPAFKDIPTPNITVTSPECGPSGSNLKIEHTQFGAERFPHLEWTSTLPNVKEYILIVQDVDAPLPTPILHGSYYALPSTRMQVSATDFEAGGGAGGGAENVLKGGFKHGKNLRGTRYSGPKPLLGHGPHRYWFQVIALSETVEGGKLSARATKAELEAAIVGKVIGWGAWIGVYEKKWE